MAKKKTTEKVEKKTSASAIASDQFAKLRKWNVWLGLLLLVEAVAIAVIGTDRSFPVTTQYLAVDTLASEATGGQTLAVATRHLFDVRLSWVVGFVLAVFAAAYFVAAWWGRGWYENRLAKGLNDLRWLMFGVGGAGLLAAVGLLSGIYEVALLASLKIFMVVGCLGVMAGGVIRLTAGDKETPVSHLVCGVGTACIIVSLAIVAIIAGGALLYDGHIPGFVYGIYATTLIAFLAVGAVTHLRIIRKGKWADSLNVEKAYMVFGFLGASVIAWQMFAGALLP